MSNNDQFQLCLYHSHLKQPHPYTRQIIRINEKTTCQEVLRCHILNQNTARLIETGFGFDNHHSQYLQRRRTTMRSPSVNNNHQSSHEFNSNKHQTNINQLNINNQIMNYSLSELQEIAAYQQEQIELNKQLLCSREQRLQYLKEQQTTQENLRLKRLKQHIEQQEIKHLRLKTLQNQINQQKYSNSTIENDLEILKKIFLNKEQELTITLNKVDELTKQLDQLRKLKITTNKEQSQNNNELDKLKQELMIRNKLNEQQNRKITYQREIITSKQAELSQLDRRIEELQQRLKMKTKSTVVEPVILSTGFKTALDTVQDTLNNINIVEIEKRMVQLANSFNAINTSGSSIVSQYNQINNSNSSKKTKDGSSSVSLAKITFASKSEIAAAYMAGSSITLTSSPSHATNLPIVINKSTTDMIDSQPSKIEEQLLPPNLRLNDDILSIHFNNITSNIKKRHSLSDANDSFIKHLSSNLEQQQQQQQPIHVRDDSLINSSLSDTKSTISAYENLFDLHTNINNDNSDGEQETIIESVISDTESEGSLSEDIESIISFPINITTSSTNYKSLLKTPTTPKNTTRRVIFDPLALLLDAAVIGELELLIKSAKEVKNPSQPNDEGLTALHNAVCASNFECVKFLVEFGCDINYADNDGWTPLHCAASCNNTSMVAFLIEHGACIYAATIRDNETAAEKCEEEEENYTSCSQYLLNVQNDLGVINNGLVYALYDYEPDSSMDNELEFKDGDSLTILRRGDEYEKEWWWTRHETTGKEGYIPRNYLGLYPRVRPGTMASTNC
ncbi:unnamed protein product [Rotaria sp. Silwood1]|nr:unnamed protein product [Rotaria sp. Silwood1]